MIELTDTNSSQIAAAFIRARIAAGSPAMGMVMTLIVVVPEDDAGDAMAAAKRASREHPSRVLCVILGSARGAGHVHAQVSMGDGWGGETAVIRLKGEVVKHAESVVLPLLLPDSPVAIWWPVDAPDDVAHDPLGALAQRRITDSSSASRGKSSAMQRQCQHYAVGNTDLSWTRLTPWRALLAAALDQHPLKVRSARVTAERVSPSADLLVAWLADRLKVEVTRSISDGPGITDVTLETKDGPITIHRADGRLASFSSPGRPDRPVALKRREVPALLTEELRRLDEDDVYAETAARLVALGGKPAAPKKATKKAATKRTGKPKPSSRRATTGLTASTTRTGMS